MGLFALWLNDPNSPPLFGFPLSHSLHPIAMIGKSELWCAGNRTCLSYGLLILGFLATTWLAGKKSTTLASLMHGTNLRIKDPLEVVKTQQLIAGSEAYNWTNLK